MDMSSCVMLWVVFAGAQRKARKDPAKMLWGEENFVDFRSSRSLNGSFSTESWGYSGICPMMIINKARIVEGLRSKTGYKDKGSV